MTNFIYLYIWGQECQVANKQALEFVIKTLYKKEEQLMKNGTTPQMLCMGCDLQQIKKKHSHHRGNETTRTKSRKVKNHFFNVQI